VADSKKHTRKAAVIRSGGGSPTVADSAPSRRSVTVRLRQKPFEDTAAESTAAQNNSEGQSGHDITAEKAAVTSQDAVRQEQTDRPAPAAKAQETAEKGDKPHGEDKKSALEKGSAGDKKSLDTKGKKSDRQSEEKSASLTGTDSAQKEAKSAAQSPSAGNTASSAKARSAEKTADGGKTAVSSPSADSAAGSSDKGGQAKAVPARTAVSADAVTAGTAQQTLLSGKSADSGAKKTSDSGAKKLSDGAKSVQAPMACAAPSENKSPSQTDSKSDSAPCSEKACTQAADGEKPKWYIPQKWKDISILRKLIMILSAALALFSMLPLAVGVISPGILPPVMIAAFFFACALYWPLIDGCESTLGNILIAVTAVCVLAGVTYLSFVSGKMISASANVLPEDRGDVTVVVLGCKINGDQPSRMLHARLEKASEFLLEHPQAHCIVTGGKGSDEDYPEAYVMKNYLVSKGISPMRIIMEDKSTSTLENITFAAELAEIYNCHERFLIVTDRFHQYRAVSTANDLGIVSYALNVETVWYLAMPYWFREMAAITRDWLTEQPA